MRIQPYPQQGVAVTCRSFDEYKMMFDLTDDVLGHGSIVDIASGASSFTAEACRAGYEARAVDPTYGLSPELLRSQGKQEIATSTEKLNAVKAQYDWSYYGSIEAHRANRERSLQRFYEHYQHDKMSSGGCYVEGAFPKLPFADESQQLILCSHFLFLYHDQYDYDFHRSAIDEMVRICSAGGQIRIYPLMTLRFEPYPHLNQLLEEVRRRGAKAHLHASRLPFIPGSSQLLIISKIGD